MVNFRELKMAEKKPVNLTINPSEQIVKSASKEFQVTDSLGRTITIKKPNPLANLDFAKAAGGEKLNMLYLSEVAHLKFVAAIDDQVVACPSTEGELRALYQRLGQEGNDAAQVGVAKHFYGIDSLDAESAEVKK
jgi:hypothetical protein